jgi:hypothetical protein
MITVTQKRKGKREEEDLLNRLKGSASSEYIPNDLGSYHYDASKFANIGKSLKEMSDRVAKAKVDAEYMNQQSRAATEAADLSKKAGGLNSNTRDDNDDADGLLAILRMIFKIVPIGMSIVNNTKTLTQGFKESGLGLAELIKNLAITTMRLGVDSIIFGFELGYYAFKMMICSVGGIMNLHKCILFYLIDFILLFFLLIIVSVLFMIDTFLGMKAIIGISCVELFILGLDLAEKFDVFVYDYTGIHIFHYPDFVINMCYKCSAMGNTGDFSESSRNMYNDIFVMVPNKIGSPIGNIVRGIGKIFGFFNI